MTVEQAVEDIIHRGEGELRKAAFGDDSEEAKHLLWSREQAWTLIKQLARKEEVRPRDQYIRICLNEFGVIVLGLVL